MDGFALNQEQSVMVIVDVQERLSRVMSERESLLKNIQVLLTAANSLGIPVILTEQYPEGLGNTEKSILEQTIDAPTVRKTTFDACTDDFMEVIGSTGKSAVLLVGMETHICVFQTARGLLDHGYQVFLVKDAVCSRQLESKDVALSLLATMGVRIITTEMALFDWLKGSDTPYFKTLVELIK